MDRQRVLELALEELYRQRNEVEGELAALRNELEGTGAPVRHTKSLSLAGPKRGRKRTAAERKAHSIRMKQIWAARRAKAAKPANKNRS